MDPAKMLAHGGAELGEEGGELGVVLKLAHSHLRVTLQLLRGGGGAT